jgi:hypothetical protein
VHALGVWGFPSKVYGYQAKPPEKFGKFDIEGRKIYSKLLVISFNHVNNVMDIYTQSSQKHKLVYACIQWKLNVSVNM